MRPVAVLGAGIAGLTAARALHRSGVPVKVFEAGRAIGGLASSFKDADGFSHDFGAHFVSNRLAGLLGANAYCEPVKHYGEAVWLDGKSYSYPFGLMRRPAFAIDAIKERWHERPIETAADWYTRKFGVSLAERVAIPLTEAWSGAPAVDLSPSIGQKFGPRILKALYLSAAAIWTGKAVCNGYSHEMPESADVYHVYPNGGISKLLEPTAHEIRDLIQLESPVEAVLTANNRVEAVRVKGETIEVSAVVSTAPVNILPKLVQGTSALDYLARFRYRPMLFVNLHFNGRNLLPTTMIWTPDRGLPFFRLTETTNSVPHLAPAGKTIITCDIGCQVGDGFWTMAEDDLIERCLAGISTIIPDIRSRYLKSGGVMRTPIAYPMYLSAYETDRLRFVQSSGVDGLYSVGRNGEFAHILMEDVYWRTLKRMEELKAYIADGSVPGLSPSLEELQSIGNRLHPIAV